LTNPALTGQPGTGFDADDGASLLMAFRGLQAESVSQGQVHASVAKELDNLVADPFEEWAYGFRDRVKQSRRTVIDEWLRSYEQGQGEVRHNIDIHLQINILISGPGLQAQAPISF
jgi:hypothetical protein